MSQTCPQVAATIKSQTKQAISLIETYTQKQFDIFIYNITHSEKLSSLNKLISVDCGISEQDVRRIFEPKRKNLDAVKKTTYGGASSFVFFIRYYCGDQIN
jgi:hypothetical protein